MTADLKINCQRCGAEGELLWDADGCTRDQEMAFRAMGWATAPAFCPDCTAKMQFVVRLYDHFDGWMDVSGPLSRAEAEERWDKKTKDGTERTEYKHGSYYAIYPADTRMIYTPETLDR